MSVPVPADEEERLVALGECEILDTPPDPRFDAFVRLAAELNGAPLAAISLIDKDRQWFKARHGLTLAETPRDVSFCGHAILDPTGVTVVEDAAADTRFSDNPLVLGDPHIRFYAGAPLCTPEGHPLGVLCVLDREPRTLDEAGRQQLAGLAAGVSLLLEEQRQSRMAARGPDHDLLTGLPGRSSLEERVTANVQAAQAGRPFALLLLSMNGVGAIVSAHGPLHADGLRRQVGSRLAETVRARDLVARTGEDDFAIVMAAPADAAGVAALVARIKAQMARPFAIEREQVILDLAIGSALCPLDALAAGDLLQAAQDALDLASEETPSGGHAQEVSAFPAARRDVGRGGPGLAADLRTALDRGELAPSWQPCFRASDGHLVGHEALARWNRPQIETGADVDPSLMIPVAEAAGVIPRLDAWILHTACAEGTLQPPSLTVAVNLSEHWFSGSGDAVALVTRTLSRTGLPAARLLVEMTERALVASPDRCDIQIAGLKALGVRVALDNFGTGFASLAFLRRFGFDVLKLARGLVHDAAEESRAAAVLRCVAGLGRALGMTIVGEGVETAAQLALLRQSGCHLVQGYLLGRPEVTPHATDADPRLFGP